MTDKKGIKFKSDDILKYLPQGVTHSNEVSREDALVAIDSFIKNARKLNWLLLLFDNALGMNNHWDLESVYETAEEAYHDLKLLKSKLIIVEEDE